MKEQQTILWRSFKIIDRWNQGVIIRIVSKKRFQEFHIQTTIEGRVTTIVRYTGDVKPLK
jgi:hypothetical protein